MPAAKPDDAIAFLQLNAELFPQYAGTCVSLAQAYGRKNDSAAQIRSLEKALELDPQNVPARCQLDQSETIERLRPFRAKDTWRDQRQFAPGVGMGAGKKC